MDGEVEVEIYGDIDTNRVGTYTIFYKAKDKAGNISIDTRFLKCGRVETLLDKNCYFGFLKSK